MLRGMRWTAGAVLGVLAWVATGCGPADPGDLWLGEYQAHLEELQWTCGGTPPTVPSTATAVWRIDRDSLGLYLDGDCPIHLDATSEAEASPRHVTCRDASGELMITGGTLYRDTVGTITGGWDYTGDVDGACVEGRLDVRATRR